VRWGVPHCMPQAPAKDIEFGSQDGSVLIGLTRTGKTTGALYSLQRQAKGVLFFNTQQIPFPRSWTRADADSSMEGIIDGLIAGEKIVWTPQREYRQQELRLLIGWLFKMAEQYEDELDIYVVIDECHLFTGKALDSCIELATTGIRWGLKPVWISQRPARIDNTLISQATRFVVYDVSQAEYKWLAGYGYPSKEMSAKLNSVRPADPEQRSRAYVVYNGWQLIGPQRVSI
jgi:hypothetical protein